MIGRRLSTALTLTVVVGVLLLPPAKTSWASQPAEPSPGNQNVPVQEDARPQTAKPAPAQGGESSLWTTVQIVSGVAVLGGALAGAAGGGGGGGSSALTTIGTIGSDSGAGNGHGHGR